LYKILITYLLFLFPILLFGQESEKLTKEINELADENLNAELTPADTIIADSIAVDSIQQKIKK